MNKYKIDYEIQYDDEEGGQSDYGSIAIDAEDANSAHYIAEEEIMSDEARYGGYISDISIIKIIK